MAGVTATVKTVWDAPAVLQAPLRAVFKPAARACFAVMDKASPDPDKAGIRVLSVTETVATAKGTGLASMFEHGRKGGYPIYPKASSGFRRSYGDIKRKGASQSAAGGSGTGVLVFGGKYISGGLSTHVLGGPEAPRPFMMAVATSFAPVFYNPAARVAISGAGSSLVSSLL